MMKWFRKTQLDPLAVSMSGVKLGNRLLVVGCSDPGLIAALAARAGLTGRACAVDALAELAERAGRVAEQEGALVETSVSPPGALTFDDGSFDVVVLRDVLPAATPEARTSIVGDTLRVLRPGGRCLVIDGHVRSGLGGLFRPGEPSGAGAREAMRILETGGFAAVRTLAQREGQTFVEGVKRNV
jgi:ubiquinone/menaquinone biosynthesis C-methylase UbiE